MRSRKERPSKETLQELTQNHSLIEIAELYDISPKTVRKWIGIYGIGPEQKPKTVRPSKEDLEQDVTEKCSLSTMAKKYDANITTVARWLKFYGIKTLRHKGLNKGDKISPEALLNKPRLFGEKNPFFGKKHSAETRQKMSENHADFTGDKNPFKKSLDIQEKRQEHSERCKQLWASRDTEWRKAFAEKLSARPLAEITKQGRNHKTGYHYSSKIPSSKFWYRSSWEKDLAEKLDLDNRIHSYDFEKIRIQITLEDGYKRWTYCDFLVTTTTGHQAMIEVKPTPIALLKQKQLMMQVTWCLDNACQYAIVDADIITNSYSELINAICTGECNAGKYVGRGPIAPTRCIEILRNGQPHR